VRSTRLEGESLRQRYRLPSVTHVRRNTGAEYMKPNARRSSTPWRPCSNVLKLPSPLPGAAGAPAGGGLIWRLRSGDPAGQNLFALTGTTGRNLLQTLTPTLQRLYLDIEAERLRLNMRYRIATTATRSLIHYLDRYAEVRAMRKSLETK
jgi:hypothetical protein